MGGWGGGILLLIVFDVFPISTFADATRYHSCVYALLESKVYSDFYNDDNDDDGDDGDDDGDDHKSQVHSQPHQVDISRHQ